MEIIAPVTDYIRSSILTSRGDLVKHDGTAPKRLPIGPSGKILRVIPAGDDIDYVYPGAFLFDDEDSGNNTTVVTVPDVDTVIMQLEVGNILINGRYYFLSAVSLTKGATEGITKLWMEQIAGTGELETAHNTYALHHHFYHPANTLMFQTISGIWRVILSGTLTMALRGRSIGSDCSVQVGSGELYYNRMLKE